MFYPLCHKQGKPTGINNTVLEQVDYATYLGIRIHKSLSFSEHINKTANKCSSRLGFLRRNLKKCPQQLKQTAYFSLVWSTAEYSATVWDPHLIKDIYALEKIQNHAVRWVCGVSPKQQVSITALRKDLKWPTLEDRRRNQRLAFMFKMCNGQVAVTLEEVGLHRVTRTRHNHRWQDGGEEELVYQSHGPRVECITRLHGGGWLFRHLQEPAVCVFWLGCRPTGAMSNCSLPVFN